ncbi:MAG: DUF5995 family protein [Saprospiraceae bacterium]
MICRNITEVVAALDQIVSECKTTGNALGYFAVLYRQVTRRVRTGILAGEFEDNARMERLVVLFANRYLEAYSLFQQQLRLPQSWQVAFEATRENGPIVMQHLLLGINAHINLDLGIAAVAAADSAPLASIQRDFNDINRVLSELVAVVKTKLGRLSPAFAWLMPLALSMDEKLVDFSIEEARDGAWRFAQQLKESPDNLALITERDQIIYALGCCLARPNRRLQGIVQTIRWFERGSVSDRLMLLETE